MLASDLPHIGPGFDRYNGDGLIERVDLFRVAAVRQLDSSRRAEMGQYPTPPAIARFMAAMFGDPPEIVRLLDAGAGVGTLTAAFVEDACNRHRRPKRIESTAFELDEVLAEYLRLTQIGCQEYCQQHNVEFQSTLHQTDFIAAGVAELREDLFASPPTLYNRAILNPPYRKIQSDSLYRVLLREIGIETSNLYAGFLAIAIGLLEPGGELVAITPRSFCNGPYFKPFRKLLLDRMALKQIHVFEARNLAFSEDEVLQENIIFHAIKAGHRHMVTISKARTVHDDTLTMRDVPYDQVVLPNDPNSIIHIATSEIDSLVQQRAEIFRHSLDDLGLSVSTGRVVDFRVKGALLKKPEPDSVPLIYPGNFEAGIVRWPNLNSRKPQGLALTPQTQPLVLPAGDYVLVKRFSAKEEARRIVAALLKSHSLGASLVAFENHLNFYHINNAGLPLGLAKGLTLFLNSTLIDAYFRQFSGHTQVNAADLRMLRYPSRSMLERLGAKVGAVMPSQQEIDALIEEEMHHMTDPEALNPVAVKQRIDEALEVLQALDLPKGQLNERSALTLLALLGLESTMPWKQAQNPLMGITPIMDFCRDHYGTKYAPNTRETFRRQTMHQFMEACLVVANPDEPERPVNSPKWCYQIEPKALQLLRTFGTPKWEDALHNWRSTAKSLRQRYAQERAMNKVPLQLAEGRELYLSPGSHSKLIRAIVEEFAPRFAPGGQIIYVGDTGDKWGYFDSAALQKLGVTVDEHGKMPDVVIYYNVKDWLLLVEAVTSHGPVDAKRRDELARLFAGARPGIVYVTAFLTRREMMRYLPEISWSTEVWVAEAESHLIHFNGERFLGPYEDR